MLFMVNWAGNRDIAKQMCPPPGTQIHNPFGAALATSAPQMLQELFGMFADSDWFSLSSNSEDSGAIERLSNDDTQNIKNIINKLKNADPSKKPIYKAQLKVAIENYYSNHDVGDNPTIDRLCRSTEHLT